MADAARSQQGELGEDGLHVVDVLVEDVGPDALVGQAVLEIQVFGVVLRGQQVHGRALGEHADVRVFLHFPGEHLDDVPPGVVVAVEDAGQGVAAFPGQVPVRPAGAG